MNPIEKTSRRGFLRNIALLALALPFLGRTTKLFAADETKPAGLPDGATAIPESDPVATAIKYKEKPGKGNKKPCDKCAFYAASNKDWGKCQMLQHIPNGVVAALGTCGSWQPKTK